MSHFFHVTFRVTNAELCGYAEFLNSRNQVFVSNSRKSFSVFCFDILESSPDLYGRVLFGCFPWLYCSCWPRVPHVYLALSSAYRVCQGFSYFALMVFGLLSSYIKLVGLCGRSRSKSLLLGLKLANASCGGTRRVFPAVRRSSPSSKTRTSSALGCCSLPPVSRGCAVALLQRASHISPGTALTGTTASWSLPPLAPTQQHPPQDQYTDPRCCQPCLWVMIGMYTHISTLSPVPFF